MNNIEKFRNEVMNVFQEKIATIRITERGSDVYISMTKNGDKYSIFLPPAQNVSKSELYPIVKHLLPDEEDFERNLEQKITKKKLISLLDKFLSQGKKSEILFAYAPNKFEEANRLIIKKSVATLYE